MEKGKETAINLLMQSGMAEVEARRILDGTQVEDTPLAFSGITVDADFIGTFQNAAKVMLVASAELQNSIRLIERHHPYASDALIVGTLGDIKTVAGDLSETWANLDQSFSAYDLGRD